MRIKRALSIILAACMAAAMLPGAALAADEGAAAGIAIKYDIAAAMVELDTEWESDAANLVPFTDFNYELTNGFFKYAGSSSADDTAGGAYHNYQGQHSIQLSSGNYIAFEVFIPAAGTYTMNMYNSEYDGGKAAAGINVYLNKNKVSTNDGDKKGFYPCYKEGQKTFTLVETPNKIEDIVIAEAGYYIFTFKATASYGTVGKFELVSGDGTGKVLTSLKTSVDKEALIMGNSETAKVSVDGFYLNDGTLADSSGYSVSFSSSDESVVKVDSSTGEVTAVSAGEAAVTASAVNESGAEVKSSVNIAVADGALIKYDIVKDLITELKYNQSNFVKGQTPPSLTLTALTEEETEGFYSYFGGNDSDGSRVKYYSNLQLGSLNTKVAFKINVPAAGYYNIVHDIVAISPSNANAARQNVDVGIYVSKDAISTTSADYVGAINAYGENYTEKEKMQLCSGTVKFDEPGSYIITFKLDTLHGDTTDSPYAGIYAFYLVGGTKDTIMGGSITSTADSINIDEGETATVTAKGYLSSTAEAAEFTYSSSNTSVAKVDPATGDVTPVDEGIVTISATCADAEIANVLTKDIKVTSNKTGELVTDTKVSVSVTALTGGSVTSSLTNTVDEVEIGTEFTATATPAAGYEFAYWSNSNGAVLSENAKETFAANVNTSIKAVFEKLVTESDATVPVYFYNGNRELIEKIDVNKGTTFGGITKPDNPTLPGFAFDKWSIDGTEEINDTDVINDVTRVVALYTDSEAGYTVKVGEEIAASGKKYDEEVTVTSAAENFVCWKLGDKIISYDKSFTFHVWGDITLTEVTGEEAAAEPTAVLDMVGGEYFLTYNAPAGYTKLEAGILFSESGTTPDIGSFYSKAAERTDSGQFTAKPNGLTDTTARGYMIFRDGEDKIRVIYAD